MRRDPHLTAALAFLLALTAAAVTAESGDAKSKSASKAGAAKAAHIVMPSSDIKWGDAPPTLPAGAKMAVLQGDPGKAGPFTVRLKTPDGYKVAAHWHPAAENLTVIAGTFNLGMGDKLDESKTSPLSAGSYASMPAKMRHFAWTKGETEVQVSGMGPFKVIYVNPADDPSKAKKK